MKEYRSKEIQRLTGVTNMQLTHWSSKGAIVPLEDAKGYGQRRLYSWQNLIEALICRELSKSRVQVAFMQHVLSHLRESTPFWDYLNRDPNPRYAFILVHALGGGDLVSETIWERSDDPRPGSGLLLLAEELHQHPNTTIINVGLLLDEVRGA